MNPRIQQRKRPAQRAYTGLAGSALATTAEPAPSPTAMEPEPAPAKRGPKPKFGKTMTAAERQAKSRADRKAKQDDGERRSLIVKLVKMYDRQQSDVIIIDRAVLQAENRRGIDRIKRRQYLDGLKNLTLEELRQAVEGKDIPDSRGTLPGETSGDFDEKKFEAKVEAAFREAGGTEDNPRFATAVKPGGSSPDNPSDKKIGGRWARIPAKHIQNWSKLEERFREIVAGNFKPAIDFESTGHAECKVPGCNFVAPSFDAAIDHFWTEYYAGEKLWNKVDQLSDPDIADMVGPILAEARRNASKNLHHWIICGWLQEFSKPGPKPKAA